MDRAAAGSEGDARQVAATFTMKLRFSCDPGTIVTSWEGDVLCPKPTVVNRSANPDSH
jgi:hypothetical protein